jgi:hypothetical protein
MTLGEFEEALASGAARVRIELIGDGLVARRVVVGHADDLAAAEGIESRIAGMEIIGADGVMTLMLGDLQVAFDPHLISRRARLTQASSLARSGSAKRVRGLRSGSTSTSRTYSSTRLPRTESRMAGSMSSA